MWKCLPNRPTCVRAALLFVVLGGLLRPSVAVCAIAKDAPLEQTRYHRADAETIRSETQNILDDPRYRPRKGFWQWFGEKISDWDGLDIDLGPTWLKIVFWIFTTWCVLTLLAILGHFIWTVIVLLRGLAGKKRGTSLRQPSFDRMAQRSYEDMCRQMGALARRGLFREAVGVMMLALLRWLDETDILRFHESKTNGDYVMEYPRASAGREDFRRFVLAFDATVYGSEACERRAFQNLNAIFERVCGNVSKRQ